MLGLGAYVAFSALEWDLNSGLHICKADTTTFVTSSVCCAPVILEMESQELFARDGFKPQSSQSQLPK
jgi:hypothetical protein